MKLINSLFLLVLLLMHQSCYRNLVLSNITFTDNDTIKEQSLHFVNDSICIYGQRFLCDIDDEYRNTEILTSYTINKNKIILKNLTLNHDRIDPPCFMLPETQIKKCSYFNEDDNKQKYIKLDAPRQLKIVEIYAYINNITTDTLLYKKGIIYYNKWYNCLQYPIYTTIRFYKKK